MLAEELMMLASLAGNTVVVAATTDAWEATRRRFARLLGHGDARKTEVAERWLAETHEELTAVEGADLGRARTAEAQRWKGRFADLLDEDPGAEADLRALVEEIRATLPAEAVSATDHAVAAGQDVNISADRGSVAGVIHGNVTFQGPPSAPASREQASRIRVWKFIGPIPRFPDPPPGSGVVRPRWFDNQGGSRPGANFLTIRISNNSDKPVYDLVISWRRGLLSKEPWGQPDRVGTLSPGQVQRSRELPELGPDPRTEFRYGAVVYFQDANRIRWRVEPDRPPIEVRWKWPGGPWPPTD